MQSSFPQCGLRYWPLLLSSLQLCLLHESGPCIFHYKQTTLRSHLFYSNGCHIYIIQHVDCRALDSQNLKNVRPDSDQVFCVLEWDRFTIGPDISCGLRSW